MNQVKLIAAVSDRTALAKNDMEFILKEIADVTREARSTDDEVTLPDMGKLKTKWTMARVGHHPKQAKNWKSSRKQSLSCRSHSTEKKLFDYLLHPLANVRAKNSSLRGNYAQRFSK